MLIIEKVFLLKTVDLFSEIPEDKLIAVAEVAEEEFISADTVIFHKGDEGHILYIIADGEVIIHDKDKIFTQFKSGDFFGEISLLSSEKRTASAKAASDCRLLKLNQWQFYELLELNTSIFQAIIRTLCTRIVKQNQLLTQRQA